MMHYFITLCVLALFLINMCMLSQFNHVWLFVTLWIVAHQAPLSMAFSRQECWSGLSCPPSGGSFWPRDWTHVSYVSCIAGRFLTTSVTLLLFSRSVMSDSLQPHGLQHSRLPCPSPSPGGCATHVYWVGDAIQPSCPLSSPSPPAFSLSQHQGLF